MSTEPNKTEGSPDEKVTRMELQRFRVQVMLFLFALSVISYYPGTTLGDGWPRWAFQLALIAWVTLGLK
jgi:hypothetical protein